LCKKIALHSIALLPDIKKSFTGYPDELLSNLLFNTKYGKGVWAQYKLNNLNSDINKEEIWSDNKVVEEKDEFENVKMEDDLETSQIAFAEDMEDL